RFHVVPFPQLIALPFSASSPTRPSSHPSPLRTTNLLASVIRPVANSPFSLTRSKMRPCWKMAQGWSALPSYNQAPGNLLSLFGPAALATMLSASSPPAAAMAFTRPRRISFAGIEHLLSERADGGQQARQRDHRGGEPTRRLLFSNGAPLRECHAVLARLTSRTASRRNNVSTELSA